MCTCFTHSQKPQRLYVFIKTRLAMDLLLHTRIHHYIVLFSRLHTGPPGHHYREKKLFSSVFLPRGGNMWIKPAEPKEEFIISYDWSEDAEEIADWNVWSHVLSVFVSLTGWNYGGHWPRLPENRRFLMCAGQPVASVCFMMTDDGKTRVSDPHESEG